MNPAVEQMLKGYQPYEGTTGAVNALREIIQHITLLGLQRGSFFEKAAFYGGTALRIAYRLDRFSEDLDFCLRTPDESFTFEPYFPTILAELERFGFDAELSVKKTGADAVVESAFVKQPTLQALVSTGHNISAIPKNQLIKVRLEADKQNPPGANYEKKVINQPVPFMFSILDEPSLFAGKLHALLARAYLNNVKGRDFYDLLFFVSRNTLANKDYLEAKLKDSGHLEKSEGLGKENLLDLLRARFKEINFEQAKKDIEPFIKPDALFSSEDWSEEYFLALVENIKFSSNLPRGSGS